MIRIRHLYIIILCAVVAGCATIISGSTQDVTVIMPEGTRVTDAFGSDPLRVYYYNNAAMLKLQRKKDYTLRFVYKGQERVAFLSSSFEPAWILADLFTYYVSYIVDGITGDWNSFDNPLIINFPSDTSKFAINSQLRPEMYGEPVPKMGLTLSAKFGFAFPMSDFGFTYGFGLGYDAITNFTFLIAYEGGNGIEILPHYTKFYTNTSYSHINLECRYKMQGSFYITGGGGISNITSDSLEMKRYAFNDSTGSFYQNDLRTAPINKWIPTLFAGIGIAGTTSYLELRHTFGLSSIPLSNGEIGKFGTTSLTFGINLHF